jgi:hypothetical protein
MRGEERASNSSLTMKNLKVNWLCSIGNLAKRNILTKNWLYLTIRCRQTLMDSGTDLLIHSRGTQMTIEESSLKPFIHSRPTMIAMKVMAASLKGRKLGPS